MHIGLKGFFKIEAVDCWTGERRLLADWFPNLITDLGLNKMGTSSGDNTTWYRVGTGSTTPSVLDTQLVAQVASTNATQGSNVWAATTTAPYYEYVRQVKRFSPPGTNYNITELGIGWAATGTTLFSRALIKDSSGNPTTLTWLSTEFLDVSYELRAERYTTDTSATITINGVSTALTIRRAYITQVGNTGTDNWFSNSAMTGGSVYLNTGAIAAVTTGPSGTRIDASSTVAAYSNNSLYREVTSTWSLNSGSGTFQSAELLLPTGWWQVKFDPAIVKTSNDIVSMTYRLSWARV